MKLTFILADTQRTYVSITCENEHRPYSKRTVTLELTAEQLLQVKPRYTGDRGNARTYEEVLEVFVENELHKQGEDSDSQRDR